MSHADLFAAAVERLRAAGIENPRLEARLLLEHADHAGEPAMLDALLARREAREPLAYILGHKEFWSLDFAVGPGALVPRPETETLIEAACAAFPDPDAALSILDLGCGSGCLIVTALTLWPRAKGTALDLSPEALGWTVRNAARHGVAGRLASVEGRFDAAPGGPYDLILSNPPYLTAGELEASEPELDHEPPGALAAGADGLEAYRALAPVIARRLAPAGIAIIELGAGQGDAVSEIFRSEGLEMAAFYPDLSNIPRALALRLTAS